MKDKNSVSIIFWQRKDKIDRRGFAPIFMRITVNGERKEVSLNKRFDPKKWENGWPVGKTNDVKELRKDLDSVKSKVNTIVRDLIAKNEEISASKIKTIYSGCGKSRVSVLKAFKIHNENITKLENIDFSSSTVQRYKTTYDHIERFIKKQYSKNDMLLSELNYEFITNLEVYFKIERNCNHNSTMKYIKNFRKVINLAVKNEWVERDPFAKFSIKLEDVERVYLSMEELNTIAKKEFSIERLRKIRDVFLFCCYTGLAFADVKKLTKNDIVANEHGELHISQQRTKIKKGSNKAYIMLLPVALEILEHYKDDLECVDSKLLPVPAQSNYNAYLKEIADVCGIEKKLTSHVARHTFATSVTLLHGVPIETVSKMLGHRSLRSTQIYAKVIEEKVTIDMTQLKEKLSLAEAEVNVKKEE